jgi:hypothetical protein
MYGIQFFNKKYKSILSAYHALNTFELSFKYFELAVVFIIERAKFKEAKFKIFGRLLHIIDIVTAHRSYLCLGSFFLSVGLICKL